MTDQDRGAYTPQTDAPLAFDARHAHGGRGSRAPVTLIASALILAALVAALFMFYRSGVRGSGQPPQVLGAPVGETKAPPPASAAPGASAGLQVYKSEATPAGEMQPPSAAPAFVPPPEQAAPRPVAPPPAPKVVEAPPTQPAPAPKLREAPAPLSADDVAASGATASAAAPKAALKPEVSKPEVAKSEARAASAKAEAEKPKPKPKTAAAAPAETASVATPAGGRAVVQIGAFSSPAIAEKGYKDVAALVPGQMGGKSKTVESVVKDGQTFYRTAVTGFASRAQADAFCASLRASGHTCFVR
jgi:hypothetical protein